MSPLDGSTYLGSSEYEKCDKDRHDELNITHILFSDEGWHSSDAFTFFPVAVNNYKAAAS